MLTFPFVDLAESPVGVAVGVDKTGSDGQAVGFDDRLSTVRLEVTHLLDLAVSDPDASPDWLRTCSIVDQGISDQECGW
jgi:hypothetical protein